jgi:hypothetical protein
MKTGIDTLEDHLAVSLNINILLPYDPAITLLVIYSTCLKTSPHKNLHLMHIAAFMHKEQSGCS